MTAVDAGLEARASDLRELASTVAGVLASRATSTTTLACERAVLRMCGVSGLSGSGRPLQKPLATVRGTVHFGLGVTLLLYLAHSILL